MTDVSLVPAGYAKWITDVKQRIRGAQQRAALAVNKEMLLLYWQIGRDIPKPAQLTVNLPSIERLETELTEADIDALEKTHRAAASSPATEAANDSQGETAPRSEKRDHGR